MAGTVIALLFIGDVRLLGSAWSCAVCTEVVWPVRSSR